MRFIIDNQLPPALAAHLRTLGHDAVHVLELDLHKASDRQIWRHASSSTDVIISKDEDFLNLSVADARGRGWCGCDLETAGHQFCLRRLKRGSATFCRSLQRDNESSKYGNLTVKES